MRLWKQEEAMLLGHPLVSKQPDRCLPSTPVTDECQQT
jgi:hypothetical protein